MIVLALETSCDETAAAILCEERGLLASEVASQIAIHQTYGGVVPEVASRQHLTQLRPVIEAALAHAGLRMEEIDAVAIIKSVPRRYEEALAGAGRFREDRSFGAVLIVAVDETWRVDQYLNRAAIQHE